MTGFAFVVLGWFALSILFGCLWTLSAVALKEARRRWPHTAADPAWARRGRPRPHPPSRELPRAP